MSSLSKISTLLKIYPHFSKKVVIPKHVLTQTSKCDWSLNGWCTRGHRYNCLRHCLSLHVSFLTCLSLSICLLGSVAGGCCPLGWETFGSSCYLFSKTPLNWHDARDWCNGHESHLVILHTDEEWVRQPVCRFERNIIYVWSKQQETQSGSLWDTFIHI